MQKITNELRFNAGSLLEFIVLKMLSGRTYSLDELFETLKSIGFKTPLNSLYPLFSKLRRNGWVVSGYEEMDDGLPEKTYGLAEKGRRRLSELRSDWKRLNALIASLGARW